MIYIDKVISKDHRAHEYNRIVIIGLWKNWLCKSMYRVREKRRKKTAKRKEGKRGEKIELRDDYMLFAVPFLEFLFHSLLLFDSI